jgi:hypothetical protein
MFHVKHSRSRKLFGAGPTIATCCGVVSCKFCSRVEGADFLARGSCCAAICEGSKSKVQSPRFKEGDRARGK